MHTGTTSAGPRCVYTSHNQIHSLTWTGMMYRYRAQTARHHRSYTPSTTEDEDPLITQVCGSYRRVNGWHDGVEMQMHTHSPTTQATSQSCPDSRASLRLHKHAHRHTHNPAMPHAHISNSSQISLPVCIFVSYTLWFCPFTQVGQHPFIKGAAAASTAQVQK